MNEKELKTGKVSEKHSIFVLFTIFAALNLLTTVYGEYMYFRILKSYSEMDVSGEWAGVIRNNNIESFFKCFISLIPVIAAAFISFMAEKTRNTKLLKILKIFVLCYVFTDLGLGIINLVINLVWAIFQYNLQGYLPDFLHWIFRLFYTCDWSEGICGLLYCMINHQEAEVPSILLALLHNVFCVIFWILNFILIKRISRKIM